MNYRVRLIFYCFENSTSRPSNVLNINDKAILPVYCAVPIIAYDIGWSNYFGDFVENISSNTSVTQFLSSDKFLVTQVLPLQAVAIWTILSLNFDVNEIINDDFIKKTFDPDEWQNIVYAIAKLLHFQILGFKTLGDTRAYTLIRKLSI